MCVKLNHIRFPVICISLSECVTPNEQLEQHTELDFRSANSLRQQSTGRHFAPLRQFIPIWSQSVFALSP
jgi:hypothetical protein